MAGLIDLELMQLLHFATPSRFFACGSMLCMSVFAFYERKN
jgi:hypothetical protein